jgi:hypothetical protein
MSTGFYDIKMRLVFYWALFFGSHVLSAQTNTFQQQVNYTIDVQLDDVHHVLTGHEKIVYHNRSPQSLAFIYFHLWPNAYKTRSTELVRQQLRNGNNDLYFAKNRDRGYIDSLLFKANGEEIKWEYDREHIDICKLLLNAPLKSGDSVVITTPFKVKIPDARFSRLGHTGQAYFITQWYPKPAVYDQSGWHPIPYLDQGEFYSEYGNFDVSISLPKNYLLAATGDRYFASEEDEFLDKKVLETLRHIENGTH